MIITLRVHDAYNNYNKSNDLVNSICGLVDKEYGNVEYIDHEIEEIDNFSKENEEEE